jgi:hypothetical protein
MKMKLGFWLALMLWAAQSVFGASPLATPYAQKGKLEFAGISLTDQMTQYEKFEVFVDFTATYDNPFDPADIALDARVKSPSGKILNVPGFLSRPYTRELKNGQEYLNPAGKPSWHIRFTPVEQGQYDLKIQVRDRSGQIEAPTNFTAVAARSPGFVRVSPNDNRYFAFDNGQPYFPIGANVCWGGRGTYDFDDWFKRYGDAGCNYARLWLSPQWSTFALERPGKPEEGLGMGQFDLANAWRIDYVLDLAATNGLRLMLCTESYNVLREKDAYPQWDSTPQNVKNGGPLQHASDFWTNAEMDRLFQNKLRYLVARYGYSPYLFSWEFWNEVDLTTGYRTAPVRDWHQRMGRALREMDPYRHLITTSFSNTDGDKAIDTLPELDYVQTHHYNNPDLPLAIAKAQAQKAAYGKPHLVGEIGADAEGARAKDDPEGLQIHDPAWASIMLGYAGTAQPWWWDSLIAPKNLYPLFSGMARFTAGINWPGEKFKSIKPGLEWQSKPSPLPRRDAVLKDGPTSWSASDFNKPRRVRLTGAGFQGEVAGIQHGTGNHADLHNPITVEMDLDQPSRFEVEVGDVSGYGGAALRLTLDGKVVLMKDFPDADGNANGTTHKEYSGSYGADVPAGKHGLVVENTGPDWFLCKFRARNALEQIHPPLDAWGVVGKTTVLAWARLEDRTWDRVCAQKIKLEPAPPSVLILPEVTPGTWNVELWDTWPGKVIESKRIEVKNDGQAHVQLPAIEKDLAVKIVLGVSR